MSDASSPLAFTLPSAQQLQDEFRKYGVADDSLVVLYSTTHIMWATRLWWMLHWAGHQNVTLLEGGYTRLDRRRAGRSTRIPRRIRPAT